jgi:hypothetical protein
MIPGHWIAAAAAAAAAEAAAATVHILRALLVGLHAKHVWQITVVVVRQAHTSYMTLQHTASCHMPRRGTLCLYSTISNFQQPQALNPVVCVVILTAVVASLVLQMEYLQKKNSCSDKLIMFQSCWKYALTAASAAAVIANAAHDAHSSWSCIGIDQ